MFLLFDQASDFTPDQFEDLDEMFQHRDAFSHLELMKQFHLGHPVGINGFYSTWDAHCDVLHQRMQYAPLSEYFSPTQAVSAATARAERARAALFREFVLGDIFPMDAAEFNAPAPPGGIALIIEYDDDYVVEDGQIIPPTYTRTEPSVSYTPHPVAVDAKGRPAECNMYTLLLVDPDAPSRINHSMREHVKWVVLNISEDRVSQGVPALPYLSPDPAYASGLHRYVFALFKQKREFSAKEVEDSKAFFAPRSGIISYDWVKAQGSVLHGVPVGVEAFLSEWDQSIDEIHKAAGYMPPPQYRSPAQKRAVIVAEGGARPGNLFSPKSGGRNNVEVDDIHQRLKKIQEAQTRFNSQVTETTARTSALEIASQKTRAEEASRLEEQSARSTENAASEENFQQQEQRATKKVAPRAPIVMSGTSKTLSASASQGLAVNIGDSLASDGGGGTSAAEAALLASNANDELIQVSQTKETTQSATTDVSTSQQTDSSAVQQNTTSNVQDTKVYHAGVQVSEEHSEQSTEQHTETHEEKRKDYRSQKVSQSHSVGKGNNMNTNAIENGGRPLSVPKLPLGSTLEQHVQEQEQEQVQKQTQEQAQQQQQEAHDRFERAMLYDQQQAAAAVAEQQRIELEAQEDARRAQQALIQKQQQEVLERQKLEQQRALEQQQRLLEEQQQQQKRQQQLPIPPVQQQMLSQQQSPSPRAPPRKQRSHNEFFGGIPDSEYSDTDASAYDSASVFSGPPQQPSRYNYLQQSTSNSGILPSISSQRSADENEEFSDTSSSFVARPAFDTSSNSRRPASGKPAFVVDPVTRYKLIMEGIVQSKTTPQLCDLFNVSTQSIFTGGGCFFLSFFVF